MMRWDFWLPHIQTPETLGPRSTWTPGALGPRNIQTPEHLDPAHLDPAHFDPGALRPRSTQTPHIQTPEHLDPAHLDPAHLDPGTLRPWSTQTPHIQTPKSKIRLWSRMNPQVKKMLLGLFSSVLELYQERYGLKSTAPDFDTLIPTLKLEG